jgi:hypothetical protein
MSSHYPFTAPKSAAAHIWADYIMTFTLPLLSLHNIPNQLTINNISRLFIHIKILLSKFKITSQLNLVQGNWRIKCNCVVTRTKLNYIGLFPRNSN